MEAERGLAQATAVAGGSLPHPAGSCALPLPSPPSAPQHFAARPPPPPSNWSRHLRPCCTPLCCSKISEHRTSSGTFLPRGGDAVVADIEARIARWTLMPVGNGEPLQVLRYEQEQVRALWGRDLSNPSVPLLRRC